MVPKAVPIYASDQGDDLWRAPKTGLSLWSATKSALRDVTAAKVSVWEVG